MYDVCTWEEEEICANRIGATVSRALEYRLTYSILTPSYSPVTDWPRCSASTVRLTLSDSPPTISVPLNPLRLSLSSPQTLYQGHLWREVVPTCLMLALPTIYVFYLHSSYEASQGQDSLNPLCQPADSMPREDTVTSWKVKSIQFGDTYLNLLYT